VTGDLVRGFVEIKNDAGNFILQDIPEDLTVTLIPYSTTNQRGLASSIQLSATGNEPPEVQETPGTTKPSESPETPKMPETSEIPEISEALGTPEIPKAPNTGLVSRRYY